jgi:hypothetical protein
MRALRVGMFSGRDAKTCHQGGYREKSREAMMDLYFH